MIRSGDLHGTRPIGWECADSGRSGGGCHATSRWLFSSRSPRYQGPDFGRQRHREPLILV